MHFWISLSTLAGFVVASGALGYFGGMYTMHAISRPRATRTHG